MRVAGEIMVYAGSIMISDHYYAYQYAVVESPSKMIVPAKPGFFFNVIVSSGETVSVWPKLVSVYDFMLLFPLWLR